MSLKPVILLVEDDEAITTLVKYTLEKKGFEVVNTSMGDEALLIVEEQNIDLVILDWMLPGISGIEICTRLRSMKDKQLIPIIILSAKGEEDDRIKGLDVGADDYIVKPFSPHELVARVNAVLRRIRPNVVEEIFTFEDLTLDVGQRKVTRGGELISLGPKEFDILHYMMEYPNRIFSRDQIIHRIWGNEIDVSTRTVDVHITRLRNVLNIGDKPNLIATIRSAGYGLQAPKDK